MEYCRFLEVISSVVRADTGRYCKIRRKISGGREMKVEGGMIGVEDHML